MPVARRTVCISPNPAPRMTERAAYSVAQLSKRWGVSDGHLYHLIKSGDLPSFKIGTLIRVKAEEVERIECASSCIGGNGPLSEPMSEAVSGVDLFVPPTVPRQKGASRTFAPRRQGRR